MMLNCNCPCAKIADQKLVLSLPDAMTPVMWVMDLASDGAFALKVEQNDHGLFVLQKISAKNQIEDIAFYNKKAKAVRAMTYTSKAISKSRSCTGNNDASSGGAFGQLWRILKIMFVIVAIMAIGVIGYFMIDPIMMIIEMSFLNGGDGQMAMPMADNVAPVIENTNPNSVGVPLSADDFLQQQGPIGLPF